MDSRAHPQVLVVGDAAALAETAARRLIARLTRAERAAICLTGGSSPLGLYRLLAESPWNGEVPWSDIVLLATHVAQAHSLLPLLPKVTIEAASQKKIV